MQENQTNTIINLTDFRVCLITIFFYLVLVDANCQHYSKEIEFAKIGVAQGLSNSNVTCILQDRKGFLWVGTVDGLNKYNGYDFKVYRHSEIDTTSLIKNEITCLFEDSEGLLWISTRGGGLQQYDSKTDRFKRLNEFTIYSQVEQIIEDFNHTIWIAGSKNDKPFVANFNRKSGEWDMQYLFPDHDEVKSFIQTSEDEFLIGFQVAGIYKYNFRTRKLISFLVSDRLANPTTPISQCGLRDTKGNIWIAPNHGLFKIEIPSNKITFYSETRDSGTAFLRYPILNMVSDGNYIWLGTENGGVGKLNIVTSEFVTYSLDKNNPTSISDNSIWSVYKDHQQRIWLGTFSNGLCVYDPNKNKFNKLTIPLKNEVVNAIYEDNKKRLWLGTEGGLVMKQEEQIQYYQSNPYIKGSLSSDPILSIAEDKEGQLWFGTWGGGINKYIEKTNSFIHYLPNTNDPKSLSDPNVFSLQVSKQNGRLLIATFRGLNIFQDDTKEFKKYLDVKAPNNILFCLYEDLDGSVWTGSLSELNRVDLRTNKRSRFYLGSFNDSTTIGERINYFYCDKKNDLWVATGTGLYRTTDRKHFLRYSNLDGLPSDRIMGILEDEKENLWISTTNGISKFNLKTNTFVNFDMSDGLLSKEFKRKSCFKSKDGKFYFGGKGVNYFYPDSIHLNQQKPDVYITDLKIFNKTVSIGDSTRILTQDISETDEISLAHEFNFISLNYVALNFTASEKNQYAYKLKGFNKDWVYAGDQRSVAFTNLDPGDYTFYVKACNNDGLWNEEGASLVIHVLPPWWATWWFILFSIVSSGLFIFAFYKHRVRTIERNNKRLINLVRERTHELQEMNVAITNQNQILAEHEKNLAKQNEEISQQHDILTEQNIILQERREEIEAQNEELRHGQEEISAQRDIVFAQNNKLEDAHELIKTQNEEIQLRNYTLEEEVQSRTKELVEYNQQLEQFAYISAHNLRAPVARILGLGQIIELTPKGSADETEILDKMVLTAKELDGVVHDLNTILEIRKNHSANISNFNFQDLFERIKLYSEKEIEDTNVTFNVDFSKATNINSVKPYVESIVQNLISNAIKYRHPDRKPVITITTERVEDFIRLNVSDNGLGIDIEIFKEKLFGLYQRFHNHIEGKGLGLHMVKTQVTALGGKIDIESKVNEGTTFIVYLKNSTNQS